MPSYEPPSRPLNTKGQHDLASLSRDVDPDHNDNKIPAKLRDAAVDIQTEVGLINDFLLESTQRIEKLRTKGQTDDAMEGRFRQVKEKIEALTTKMELQMRKCIDGQEEMKGLQVTLKEVRYRGVEGSRAEWDWLKHGGSENQRYLSTQATQGQTQRARASDTRRSQTAPENETSDVDTADADDHDEEPDASRPEIPPVPGLTWELEQGVQRRTDEWQSKTLEHRYRHNNLHKHFRRVLLDAQHPNETIPLDELHWFNETGGAEPGVTLDGGNADEDDDLAMTREKISTKCPITLREFAEPVTSSKCPHTFEKQDIMKMIQSQPPPSRGAGQSRSAPKAMKCPLCDNLLTVDDLQPDPVIIRKIRRLQRVKQVAEDGEQDDETEGDVGTSRRKRTRKVVEDIDDESGDDIEVFDPKGKNWKNETQDDIEDIEVA